MVDSTILWLMFSAGFTITGSVIIWLIFLFLLGLAVGSFLNVLIYRFNSGESALQGRSKCPHCQHKLGALDLIPVFSYLFLRGKCRYCQEKISSQYVWVELVNGILFALIGFMYIAGWSIWGAGITDYIYFAFSLFIVSVMVLIFVYDLKHYLILDKVVFPALAIAGLAAIFLPQIPLGWALLSSGVVGGFFLFLVLLSKEKWMGWGDVKLGFLIGLVIPWPATMVLLMVAFVGGTIVSLLLIASGKKSMKDVIPFGTFLAAATIVTMIFGELIINWYFNLL